MTTAVGAKTSDFALEVVVKALAQARLSSLALAVVYAPPETIAARSGDVAALVPYAMGVWALPRISDLAMEVVYSTALSAQERTLAWTFTLDGHTFYVVDIGDQGTFLYDFITQSWCKFQTHGNTGWNFRNGTMWNTTAPRIVGGDSLSAYVWELDPTAIFDDGFRDIEHAATAGVSLRSRVFVSMSELRIAASAGLLDDTTDAAYIQLTYSDDGGITYSEPVIVQLIAGATADGAQDIRFSSLGAFMAPGRVLQLFDVGGVLRLDGIDAMLDGYDGAGQVIEAE